MRGVDAVVVGSGPNGLTAAARIAASGRRVMVLEAADTIGGGARTEELTEPGFLHDVCSAVHPFGVASPAFRALDLAVDWVVPPVAVSHPLDGGRSAVLLNDVSATADALPPGDGTIWEALLDPIVSDLEDVVATFLAPRIIPSPWSRSHRVLSVAGARSARHLASRFESEEARALVAGLAAHAVAPLDRPLTAGVALLLAAVGNRAGWPVIRGGSGALSASLSALITANHGEIRTGERVTSLDGMEGSTVFLDTNPHEARVIGRTRMSPAEIVTMGRWRPGPGVFKIDYALDGPVPWADRTSHLAGTVHIGGTFDEVADAEEAVFRGEHPERPFVIFAQQSEFDPHRAPEGKSTGWAYCHVPNGSQVDMTGAIEAQIERFAPGFTARILARSTRDPSSLESHNPNYVGGDIGGGRFTAKRFLPKAKNPYRVGDRLFFCSSATPPGGGAHGMCGWNAAGSAFPLPELSRRTIRPAG